MNLSPWFSNFCAKVFFCIWSSILKYTAFQLETTFGPFTKQNWCTLTKLKMQAIKVCADRESNTGRPASSDSLPYPCLQNAGVLLKSRIFRLYTMVILANFCPKTLYFREKKLLKMTQECPNCAPWHSNQEWRSICADTVFSSDCRFCILKCINLVFVVELLPDKIPLTFHDHSPSTFINFAFLVRDMAPYDRNCNLHNYFDLHVFPFLGLCVHISLQDFQFQFQMWTN